MSDAPSGIKAIVVDIDGTITDSRRWIQPRGIEALRVVQERGVVPILASGNVLPIAYGLHTFIGLGGPIIAENGGMVAYREELHRLHSIEVPLRAYHHLLERGVGVERLFTDRWRETEVALKRTVDPDELRGVLSHFDVIIEVTGFAIHLMEPGHSKMSGVRKVCELLDLSVEEVAAFGDSDNDTRMIAECGRGIAVANASPMVKEVADLVTNAPHSDGVIEGLRWLGIL